jgi:hypothetical protein
LSFAVSHLHGLPQHERAAVAHHAYIHVLYPIADTLLELEEDRLSRQNKDPSLREVCNYHSHSILSISKSHITLIIYRF